MTRPEDISDEVWNAAGRVVNMQGFAAKPEIIEPVARAIMDEREECAKAVEMGDSWTSRFEHAAAIRKRGEQTPVLTPLK